MTSAGPSRLLALRLQGFKSFAERTVVEFGPGISAVVGPNGSGKSNLADALRWTLGEQGRALRLRKAEDVIFAGSERRAALGMADVTLVLDNADGLLPVEYSVLELGRRLFRSGENDYLLNRQRIRLRDLVDLLDAAHLADNAFLFIGQGMVDQALALRPEERRPLFEEVAGVRRHDRRRRRAEEQLAESETNLARVEDILAELRPQARRLAAQAEQQASRRSAGEELAEALLAAAHARWHEAAARVSAGAAARLRAEGAVEAAMSTLHDAEAAVAAAAAELAARASVEDERRAAHDRARETATALRLREERLVADLAGVARDRDRAASDLATAEADLTAQRRVAAQPLPARDVALEAAVADAERRLGDAVAELATLRAASRARGEEAAAIRRAEAAREAELETARRGLHEATRRAAEERARSEDVEARRATVAAAHAEAVTAREAATAAEHELAARREELRRAVDAADAVRAETAERAGAVVAAAAALRARVEALAARLAEEEARGIARAARRRGGRRIDDELQVDPALRGAVEAALGEAARGYVVAPSAVTDLAAERGVLVLETAAAGDTASPGVRRPAAPADALLARARALGGGPLGDAVRRDPAGVVRDLLARCVWLPDLASCLVVRDLLPAGWVAVVRDGSAVVGERIVGLGRADTPLERRAELSRLQAELGEAAEAARRVDADLGAAVSNVEAARSALDAARSTEAEIVATRRRAEEAERTTGRDLEALAREAAWHVAQVARLDGEAERFRDALAAASTTMASPATLEGEAVGAIETWESRVAELRATRDRVAAEVATADAARRDLEHARARAEAAIALDEERIRRARRDQADLEDRDQWIAGELSEVRAALAAAQAAEERIRGTLDEARREEAADRSRLAAAEADAARARDGLRAADETLRAADRADLEARLGLEGLREQLLVELAGLGELGLRVLGQRRVAPDEADSANGSSPEDDDAATLAAALDGVVGRWAADDPQVEPPSPGRLATLRRRYHELGAANPYAVEEFDTLRRRLETLEGQERDLRQAIGRTRELIDELNVMIAEQFRTTFRALEVAFDARFRQLFGGGFAKLSLTDPDDLSATGVEIVARPPGKKPQALAMLSGGERALTAVALLFSMLEVRPVPFCVLDEVDAALDEANVGRFAEALRELATRTQCIVITHNRGTIESADALYGVTVGDDSVSRVISLRLDEARAIAEQRAADRLAGAVVGG